MKIEIEAKGFVKDGQFIIQNKKQFADQVQEYFPDQKVIIIVKHDFTIVSDKLRKYYFGPLLGHLQEAFKDIGDHRSKKDLDDKMRRMFLIKEEVNPESGEIQVVPKSLSKDSAEVSNQDMKEFIDQIIRFTVEHLDYGIAYPNEY